MDMARVKGTCRICGFQGMLDPHHIISQAQCKKKGRMDLISNPGNVVHICRECHKLTTSYLNREYLTKKEEAKSKPKTKAKKKAKSKKKAKPEVVCARCYRVGHESKNCKAKTIRNRGNSLVRMEIQGLPIK